MAELHVLRVFTGEEEEWGNPLGVFLDGAEIPEAERQAVAADLGYSETVFVDDPDAGVCRIFTPGLELGFAGHPTVGTAWLRAREGLAVERLRPPVGEVEVRREGELIFVAAVSGRELTIHQGRGSVLQARPLGRGRAEVGGRIVLDQRRDYRTAG